MDKLVEQVVEIQQKRGWSDGKLAKVLGVDRSYLSLLKSSDRAPGGKFLKAVARELPELQLAVLTYMASGSDSPDSPQATE